MWISRPRQPCGRRRSLDTGYRNISPKLAVNEFRFRFWQDGLEIRVASRAWRSLTWEPQPDYVQVVDVHLCRTPLDSLGDKHAHSFWFDQLLRVMFSIAHSSIRNPSIVRSWAISIGIHGYLEESLTRWQTESRLLVRCKCSDFQRLGNSIGTLRLSD